jgi:hypothetical protein
MECKENERSSVGGLIDQCCLENAVPEVMDSSEVGGPGCQFTMQSSTLRKEIVSILTPLVTTKPALAEKSNCSQGGISAGQYGAIDIFGTRDGTVVPKEEGNVGKDELATPGEGHDWSSELHVPREGVGEQGGNGDVVDVPGEGRDGSSKLHTQGRVLVRQVVRYILQGE